MKYSFIWIKTITACYYKSVNLSLFHQIKQVYYFGYRKLLHCLKHKYTILKTSYINLIQWKLLRSKSSDSDVSISESDWLSQIDHQGSVDVNENSADLLFPNTILTLVPFYTSIMEIDKFITFFTNFLLWKFSQRLFCCRLVCAELESRATSFVHPLAIHFVIHSFQCIKFGAFD